jgi:uncharacterized protein (TIGR00251 family)
LRPTKHWAQETQQGTLIHLKIQPQASQTQIVGLYGDPPRLKIRVAAPPVDGKANAELLKFLKKKLQVTAAQLQIIRGETSSNKDVLCFGVSLDQVNDLWEG